MPAPWGHPPWHVDVAIPAMPLPDAVDVAVVGGGFAGLATAWELVRRGVRTAVLEADRIGAGASGHSGAIALEGTAIGLLDDADHCLESLARITRDARIECDLRLDGCWEVTHAGGGGSGRGPAWRDGEAVLRVADVVPGGTLDPGAVLAGLARAIVAAGGTIHEHHRLEQLDVAGRVVLRTARGELVAERAVLATNAYLPTIVTLPVDLRPALTLAVATASLDESTRAAVGLRLPFYTVDLPYLWGRPLGDRLILGSGLVFPAGPDVRETRVDSDDAQAIFARLESRVRGLHPALAAVVIERRWGGPIAFVPSRAPIVAALPADARVVVTGGCAGHGVVLSFRLGELIAAHLTEDRPLPRWGAFERG